MRKEDREKKITEDLRKVYNDISGEFDLTRGYAWKEFDLLRPYIGGTDCYVADLGCGNGRLLDFLSKNGFGGNYVGVDNAISFLEIARRKYPDRDFVEGSLTDIPCVDSSIDVLAVVASFHHLPSVEARREALAEFSRVLKGGGVLYLTVWNLMGQVKYKKYVRRAFLKSLVSSFKSRDLFIPWGQSRIMRYYYAFELNEIRDLLIGSGFDIVEEEVGNNFVFVCRKTVK
jgi:demethylmenaquinone methyltransferase/2-methoxy-6-polyprenyl-1,4-benzoquinol methylase